MFDFEGLLPLEEVAVEYLKLCVDYDNSVGNTKYVLGKIYKFNNQDLMKKKFNREFENAESLEKLWLVMKKSPFLFHN